MSRYVITPATDGPRAFLRPVHLYVTTDGPYGPIECGPYGFRSERQALAWLDAQACVTVTDHHIARRDER